MTPYERCLAQLGDRDACAFPIGAIGGEDRGWARYVRLQRFGAVVSVSIYGVAVATVLPDAAVVTAANRYTMSTRAALGWLLGDHYPRLSTPGSRGGAPGDPSLTLRVDPGRSVTISPLSPSATVYYRREGDAAERVAVSHVIGYRPGDQTGDRVPITETIIGTVADLADLLGDADRAAHLLEVGRLGQHDEWMATR